MIFRFFCRDLCIKEHGQFHFLQFEAVDLFRRIKTFEFFISKMKLVIFFAFGVIAYASGKFCVKNIFFGLA